MYGWFENNRNNDGQLFAARTNMPAVAMVASDKYKNSLRTPAEGCFFSA